jgi:hypothetical protein
MSAATLIHLAGLDIDMDEGKFNDWYRHDYLPDVLRRPGWRRARCFECLSGEPRLLTIFDLDSALAGQSINVAPFHYPFAERRGIRDYHARTYALIHEAGRQLDRRDLINVVSVDIGDDHAEEFSRWYNEVHFPEILACPGWLGGRRYECVDGEPRFIAIYDLEDATRPFSSPQYRAAVGWDEHAAHLRGYHGFRIYRLSFESDAL